MRQLIEFIAKELVDDPDAVNVSQVRGQHATIIKLRVAPDDKGWVIGRRGRVANAMRTLLRVAGANQGKRRTILEIV
jgi:hypothetical protein